VKLSLYVDDITLSSKNPISPQLIKDIKDRLLKVGLSIKDKKTKEYNRNEHKIVTGCCITPNHNLAVPNQKRYSIRSDLKKLENMEKKGVEKVLGKINACQQIDKKSFSNKGDVVKNKYKSFKSSKK
jgi:hypothetical protein